MSSTNWLDLLNEAKTNGGPQDFGPIPAGDYSFKVASASVGETKQGKVKYTIKAQITQGPHSNRLVWDDLIVSPESAGAMGFFFRKLAALGLGQEFFATQPNDDQITQALTGREFIGKVIVDSWGGKDRNKIDGYKPVSTAGGGGFIPPAPQGASAPAPVPGGGFPAPGAAPAPQAAPAPGEAFNANPAPAPVPSQSPWGDAPQAAPAAAPQSGPWDQQAPAQAQAPQAAPAQAPSFPQPPF